MPHAKILEQAGRVVELDVVEQKLNEILSGSDPDDKLEGEDNGQGAEQSDSTG